MKNATTKTCKDCKSVKSINEFHKDNSMKDGLRSYCKPCHNLRTKSWREKNKKHVNAQAAKYRINNLDLYRTRDRAYRESRIEEMRARDRERYYSNVEHFRLKSAQYRRDYPDKVRASFIKWAAANPDSAYDRKNRRRAQQAKNGVFKIRKSFLRRLYSSSCVACGSTEKITQDHVIPISRGGVHSEGNLMPLCAFCNASKKNKFFMEWKINRI